MGASESKVREENGETKESNGTALAGESSGSTLAKAVIAGAAILAVGASVVSLMGDSSKAKEEQPIKTMKPPGRDGSMPRETFENDPAGYFQDLRSEQKKKKSLATE